MAEANKVSNKPQVVKRGIYGLKTNALNLVEKGNVPFLALYIHPESLKCSLLSDSITFEAVDGSDVVQTNGHILYDAHKSGKDMKMFG